MPDPCVGEPTDALEDTSTAIHLAAHRRDLVREKHDGGVKVVLTP
ncbi:hypothetical protein AB0M83_26820 [Amycolatopsis sp. NPDC051106]